MIEKSITYTVKQESEEETLRKMICNAIVHRDYHGTFTQMGTNITSGANNGVKSGVNNGANNILQLTDRQKQIIKLIQSNPTFTTKKVAQIMNVPFRTIQRDISTLQKEGYIAHIGSPRLGYWEILMS